MITNRDIVIVGQQPWDTEIGSNCKNIAVEFSKNNRVLYVNAPLDRITKFKQKNDPKIQKRIQISKSGKNGLIEISPNLWNLFPDSIIESINWIGIQKIFEYFNWINNKKVAKNIQKALDKLGFRNIILFNDNDMFRSFHLKELLRSSISIYYSRDFMLAVSYWKKHGEKLEPELIAKSDICVANSPYLANYCKRYNPHSFYIGQGCEMEIFTNYKREAFPSDIAQIPFPRIGYIGALLGLRLDIDLLLALAIAMPAWNVILVGPEDEAFANSELHQLPNVYFLGTKPLQQLPAYIDAFDICLNPQIISEVTIGNYPRKIDEYLAMGKPVVATSTEFMEAVFSEYTYLGATASDYIRLIELAIEEQDEQKVAERKKFASSHSWENSVSKIYEAIQKVSELNG